MVVGPRAESGGARRNAARRLWLRLHRDLGLTLGLVFVMLGITGSLLVFYPRLDLWLNPQLRVAPQSGAEHGYQQMLEAVRRSYPQCGGGWQLELPLQAGDRAYTARCRQTPEAMHAGFAPQMVTVNPYTLAVLGNRLWGRTAMSWIYDLHLTLLCGPGGTVVLGGIGLLLCVSLLSGLYLWWPKLQALAKALRFKRQAAPARRIYDLHKLGGVYGLVLTLMLTITGVLLAVPQWFKPAIEAVSPLSPLPVLHSAPAAGRAMLDADTIASVAAAAFPQAELRWLDTPEDAQGVYSLRLWQGGEPSRRFPKTYVWLDAYSGAVLATRDARRRSAGDALFAWLHPLHNGEALGLGGRWLILLAGTLPLLMYVTGFIRWRQKRRAAQGRQAPPPLSQRAK